MTGTRYQNIIMKCGLKRVKGVLKLVVFDYISEKAKKDTLVCANIRLSGAIDTGICSLFMHM